MTGVALVTRLLRSTLNASLQGTTPDQLVYAVKMNRSLMENASEQIHYYASFVPPIALKMASRQLSKIEKTYHGGIVGLVMSWLAEDQPVYHSLLLNMDGGKDWLEIQVVEILSEFGIQLDGVGVAG